MNTAQSETARAIGYIRVSTSEQGSSGLGLESQKAALVTYCQQRGIGMEDAVSMIVNGFCKQVLKELPMEFAVEATKLLGISLEGAVG